MLLPKAGDTSERRSRSECLVAESTGGSATAAGGHVCYRVVAVDSSRVRLLRPFEVDALEFPEATITFVKGARICAFGASPEEALTDLRRTMEERFEELYDRAASGASLADHDLEDWIVLRALFTRAVE